MSKLVYFTVDQLRFPGGYVAGADAANPKAKDRNPKAASSAGGARRHQVDKYSTSYTSIAYVPDLTLAIPKHKQCDTKHVCDFTNIPSNH